MLRGMKRLTVEGDALGRHLPQQTLDQVLGFGRQLLRDAVLGRDDAVERVPHSVRVERRPTDEHRVQHAAH